ncbi:MAG: MazG family protein [Clostridia bacterium]|nr:MazG family protein [Clostridia bacterium]
MTEKERYDFYDFYKILERLRAPGGCPWDAAQTHESLKPNLIEEAYEAAEAIDSGRGEKMADELGDVLLQVVMHSLIGKENGEFDIDDVTSAAAKKMIVRHPHVFGDVKVQSADEVLDVWDEVKKKERGEKTLSENLNSVSRALPSIKRAAKLQKKAAKVLAPQESAEDALTLFKKLSEELTVNSSDEALANVLFVLTRFLTLQNVDAEELLRAKNEKFLKKIEKIEKTLVIRRNIW